MAGSKIPKSSLVIHLKARHAQFNQKSDFFSDVKSDLSRVTRFCGRWSRETKTLGTRVSIIQVYFQPVKLRSAKTRHQILAKL